MIKETSSWEKSIFFLCMTLLFVWNHALAATPKEVITAYTDALSAADFEKAYSYVSDNDKSNFSPKQHIEFYCKKFNEEICTLLFQKTTFKIKKIIDIDNITVQVDMEKTYPNYIRIIDTLTNDNFALLITLFKESKNQEKEKLVKEQLKNDLIDGLKNNKFPPRTKKVTYRLLNENNEWKIYFEKKVPELIVETSVFSEKKGREAVTVFLKNIVEHKYEDAFNMLDKKDQEKYTLDDLLKKLEIEDNISDWSGNKTSIAKTYGTRNNFRRWSYTCLISPKSTEDMPSAKKLNIDTVLDRKNTSANIIFDSIRYEKK